GPLGAHFEGNTPAGLDTKLIGVTQNRPVAEISGEPSSRRQRRIAIQLQLLSGMALPSRTEYRPLCVGRRGEAWTLEDLDRAALAASAPSQLPATVALQLHSDKAVFDGIPAQDLENLLQFGAVRTEGPVPELTGEVQTRGIDL